MQKFPCSVGPEKIAILGSFPPLRALSGYCLELALAIAELGKVEFLSFKKIYPAFLYPGGDLKNDYTFPQIRHTCLRVNRRLTWYNPMTWIAAGLFSRADVLHAQWWSLPLWLVYVGVCGSFRLRGKPIVFTIHNVLPHESSFCHGLLCRMLFKLGNHFIVHSTPNRRQLITCYDIPAHKVTCIPMGPLDFHVPQDVDRNRVREEMGFDEDEKVVLLFGAIRPYKGIDTALQAFSRVVDEIPEARLLIAGKLWENWEPYERWIGELGIRDRVETYLEYIPTAEVYRFFCAADLVILPYHHFDSQSAVGATAVSFGKPMIVTNVGGLPDFVEGHRFVVPPRDPSALANAIIDCLKDSRQLEAMGESAEAVATKLAWPAIAKKTWAVYQRASGLPQTRSGE
jgi:glycosyltransferase involved in cell wall biosynthesis